MITSNLACGLGNLMFQIAAATALAIENNDTAGFNLKAHKAGSQGFQAYKYRDNVLRNITDCEVDSAITYHEPSFSYQKIPYFEKLKLSGNFQSEKHFVNIKELIKWIFSPTYEIKRKLLDIIESINIDKKQIISLHVRRGDYMQLQMSHRFIGLDYINKSISYFNDSLILVFSDDIDWCKNNIVPVNNNELIFIDNKYSFEDYEEMYLMSMCDHNIISNSSFSWWASYLNPNESKIVIAPEKWFCDNYVDSYQDVYYDKVIKF